MSEKLKPCPFCGGEAEICETFVTGFHCPFFAVRCINRNVCGILGPSCATEETAIKFWNTRPNPWYTGTPTEDGEYVVLCKYRKDDGKLRIYKTVFKFKNGEWTNLPVLESSLDEYELIAWYGQKIEPYEEEK